MVRRFADGAAFRGGRRVHVVILQIGDDAQRPAVVLVDIRVQGDDGSHALHDAPAAMAAKIVAIGDRDVRGSGHVRADVRGVAGNDVVDAVGIVRGHAAGIARPDADKAVLRRAFQTNRMAVAIADADAQMGPCDRHAVRRADLRGILRMTNQTDEHRGDHQCRQNILFHLYSLIVVYF